MLPAFFWEQAKSGDGVPQFGFVLKLYFPVANLVLETAPGGSVLIQHRQSSDKTCVLKAYTPGWQMGTGVPTSLAPGAYQITRQFQLAGITYWDLDDTFRVDSRRVREANSVN